MLILSSVIGFAVLIMGRQLFWVTVAGLGFVLGMNYAIQSTESSAEVILLISLGAGIVGAAMAYALQRAAAGLVGFLAGWYLAVILLNNIHWDLGEYSIILTIFGGVLGVGLISVLFDWSLILLSCLAGATIITQSISLPPNFITATFFILFILGVIIQGLFFSNEKKGFT